MSEHQTSLKEIASREAPRDQARAIGDIRQWLGISGDVLGTSGRLKRTFLYSFSSTAVLVGVINILNVISVRRDAPEVGILAPVIWEGSSWVALLCLFWIPWLAWRIAPPFVRPRWKLLVHIPADLAFGFGHVLGFIGLRKLVYWSLGHHYLFGNFFTYFPYELAKDSLGYALFVTGFTLFDHLLRQQTLIDTPGQTLTFDIRDGGKLTRVRLDELLAIASAGNYVEFVLRDGRRLLMRSPLTALEGELSPRGFLRTHRSWLVNAKHVTALKPEGSGDYSIELGSLSVPLSRRFPDALARLKEPGA
ncbi:MAG TPA: LytTR family DNA-binding domain-containing protein [Rhizomicrobium sp.]|nr:LytTR family DNA-binding domain-containing protein [Rhizomicrobium sp.]